MDIQQISDHLEITAVLHRYCRAVDSQDWDLYRTVFTEDARIDYAALRRARILPSNMLTRRSLGFGGSMLAAPTLSPNWDWVPIWRAAHPALP